MPNKMATMQGCCCAAPDDCDATGSRPSELQVTYPVSCGTRAGAHLLTNGGTYADMLAATGVDPEGGDPDEIERYCWCWWEASEEAANEWYLIFAINNSPDVLVATAIWRTGVGGGVENWTSTAIIEDWSEIDGLTIGWFGQSGTSQCTGTPADALIELPP